MSKMKDLLIEVDEICTSCADNGVCDDCIITIKDAIKVIKIKGSNKSIIDEPKGKK